MRREDDPGAIAQGRVEPAERRPHAIDVGGDERGMLEPVADVRDLDIGQARLRECGAGVGDVLAVLRAARVAAVRGGDDADGPTHAGARQRRQRIGRYGCQLRMPDDDRQG